MIDYVKTAINGISSKLKELDKSKASLSDCEKVIQDSTSEIRKDLDVLRDYQQSTVENNWYRITKNQENLKTGDVLYDGKDKWLVVDKKIETQYTRRVKTYLQSEVVQFPVAGKALYKCDEVLSGDNTYSFTPNFTLGHINNTPLYFKFGIDVPAGSLLMIVIDPNRPYVERPESPTPYYPWSLKAYTELGEYMGSATIRQGSVTNMISLGNIDMYTVNGNINSFDQVLYGEAKWETSTLRQYLNSNKPAGQWFKPQDKFSVCEDQGKINGYLYGKPKEFVENLESIGHHSYYYDNLTNQYKKDYCFDKVIIPSARQLFIQNEIEPVGENDVESFDYYKILNDFKPFVKGDVIRDKYFTTLTKTPTVNPDSLYKTTRLVVRRGMISSDPYDYRYTVSSYTPPYTRLIVKLKEKDLGV